MSRPPSGASGGRVFRDVFTGADLDLLENNNGCPAWFRSFLATRATELWVEFLRNDDQPLDMSELPLLRIILDPRRAVLGENRDLWVGCTISMYWTGGNLDRSVAERAGTALITLVGYRRPHVTATAAYAFPAQGNATVLDWINIFRGRTPLTRPELLTVDPIGDLMQEGFQFSMGRLGEGVHGCHDFITQCFVRLYAHGQVRWEGHPITVPNDPTGITMAIGTSVGFDHMMGHTHRIIYQEPQPGSNRNVRIPIRLDTESSPMRRGEFAGEFAGLTRRAECVLSRAGNIIWLPYDDTQALETEYGSMATLPPSGEYGDDQNWQDPSSGGYGGSGSANDQQGQWEQQIYGGGTWDADGEYDYSGHDDGAGPSSG